MAELRPENEAEPANEAAPDRRPRLNELPAAAPEAELTEEEAARVQGGASEPRYFGGFVSRFSSGDKSL